MDKRKIRERKWNKRRNSVKVIQDRVLRNIPGCRRDDVAGDKKR